MFRISAVLISSLLRPGDEEGSSAAEMKVTEGVAVPGAPSVCVILGVGERRKGSDSQLGGNCLRKILK